MSSLLRRVGLAGERRSPCIRGRMVFFSFCMTERTHPIRVLVAKPGLDGHDRGAR